MKKGLFLLSFFFVLGVAAANAQSCQAAGKSCCASKASKAASVDANIEKRMADDGTLSYVRKEADAQGNVKFVSVQFDEASNTFVNVAPKSISNDDKAGLTKKACAASGEGKSCSPSEAKACGAGKEGKACCAAKAKVEQK
ncbi:MAG: hypothetical protein IT260_11090 [Saprospiraceae bacterium]|nr:hypothetical protein [Saprospiraceae bacterium]